MVKLRLAVLIFSVTAIIFTEGVLDGRFPVKAHRRSKINRVEGVRTFASHCRPKINRVGAYTTKSQHTVDKFVFNLIQAGSIYLKSPRTEKLDSGFKMQRAVAYKLTELGFLGLELKPFLEKKW